MKKVGKVFGKVHREKPKASRPVSFSPTMSICPPPRYTEQDVQESRESYFVALKKRGNVDKEEIMRMPPN